MAKKSDEIKDLFNEWKNGRLQDLAGIQFSGNLRDYLDHYVITTRMPETTQHVSQVGEDQRAPAKIVIHVFTGIVSREIPVPGGGTTYVAGNAWECGDGLRKAMPFPSLEMAKEFDTKLIDLPGTTIMKVSDFLEATNL
jgi:hypothetical protein